MSDDELAAGIKNITVFSRIEPLHTLRIVNALRANGEIVAMFSNTPDLTEEKLGLYMLGAERQPAEEMERYQ